MRIKGENDHGKSASAEWEYIPDGEPRVFGSRVYIYGSHDRAGADSFCDHKLKVWSAPVDDLNSWTCHGDIFHTRPDRDHSSDTDWTDEYFYAPDVVEKDGRYYLYCYILGSKPDGKGRYIMRLSCSHRQIDRY